MKVLLVEDDATIADFVQKGLREAGFVVDVASDGLAGLSQALAGGHDAAIVDVMLPHMDGLALIGTLMPTLEAPRADPIRAIRSE